MTSEHAPCSARSNVRVIFRPEGSVEEDPPETPDEAPDTAPLYLHREYRRTTIRAHGPRHLPPRQSPELRNHPVAWAVADGEIAVRKFPRLAAEGCLREWLEAVGRDQRAPSHELRGGGAAGATGDFDVFLRLFCRRRPTTSSSGGGGSVDRCRRLGGSRKAAHAYAEAFKPSAATPAASRPSSAAVGAAPLGAYAEFASMTLWDLLHADCSRLAKLGACTPLKARQLAVELERLRRVVTAVREHEPARMQLRGPRPLLPPIPPPFLSFYRLLVRACCRLDSLCGAVRAAFTGRNVLGQ